MLVANAQPVQARRKKKKKECMHVTLLREARETSKREDVVFILFVE
jgi:hypothetical protein